MYWVRAGAKLKPDERELAEAEKLGRTLCNAMEQ